MWEDGDVGDPPEDEAEEDIDDIVGFGGLGTTDYELLITIDKTQPEPVRPTLSLLSLNLVSWFQQKLVFDHGFFGKNWFPIQKLGTQMWQLFKSAPLMAYRDPRTEVSGSCVPERTNDPAFLPAFEHFSDWGL